MNSMTGKFGLPLTLSSGSYLTQSCLCPKWGNTDKLDEAGVEGVLLFQPSPLSFAARTCISPSVSPSATVSIFHCLLLNYSRIGTQSSHEGSRDLLR